MTRYICNGPRQFAGEHRMELSKRIKRLQRQAAKLDEAESYPLREKIAELELQAKALDDLPEDHALGRAGCGADLTAQINAVPDDGDSYTYRCPKCGNVGTMSRTALPESAE